MAKAEQMVRCPECGKMCKARGIGAHRRLQHGIRVKTVIVEAHGKVVDKTDHKHLPSYVQERQKKIEEDQDINTLVCTVRFLYQTGECQPHCFEFEKKELNGFTVQEILRYWSMPIGEISSDKWERLQVPFKRLRKEHDALIKNR